MVLSLILRVKPYKVARPSRNLPVDNGTLFILQIKASSVFFASISAVIKSIICPNGDVGSVFRTGSSGLI
jgi:hypothetical protein